MSTDSAGDSPNDLAEDVAQLKRVVAAQAQKIEALEAKLDGDPDAGDSEDDGTLTVVDNWFSRRSLIQTLGIAGLAGYGTGVAAADPTGQIGTPDKPLRMLYTESIGAGLVDDNEVKSLLGTGLNVDGDALSAAEAAGDHVNVAEDGSTVAEDIEQLDFNENFAVSDSDTGVTVDGENPSVDDSGSNVTDDVVTFDFNDNLNLSETDDGTVEVNAKDTTIENTNTNTHTDVSDSGSTVVSSTDDINFGSNLSVTDDGDGSVSVSGTSGGSWSDSDDNSLLEPSGSETGIEVTDVNTDNLTDNGSGQVSLGNLLDLNGNNLTDSGGDVALSSPLDLNGNSLTDNSGNLTIQSTSANKVKLNTDGGTRALQLGVPGTDTNNHTTGANFLAGHPNNAAKDSAVGVVIGGGGNDGGDENVVADNYGTVSGGRNNTAGDSGDAGPEDHQYATVGGGKDNTASRYGATVAGGRSNSAKEDDAAVGGGFNNTASNFSATVAGGKDNTASIFDATIAGGNGNTAESGGGATVGGGISNRASAADATVAGGTQNTASGDQATVPGGENNTADGQYSFAAGRRAKTNGHDGAFVWADSTDTDVKAQAADEVRFAANGNFVIDSGNFDINGNKITDSTGEVTAETSSGQQHTVTQKAQQVLIFGADFHNTGYFAQANGRPVNGDVSTSQNYTKYPAISGTIDRVIIQTQNDLSGGSSSVDFKIHVNGSVQTTLTTSSKAEKADVFTGLGISVSDGDSLEVEYDSNNGVHPRDTLAQVVVE